MDYVDFGETLSPVKVLIYSSKEIYDNAGFEGRAEADLIAYRDGCWLIPVKSKISGVFTGEKHLARMLELWIHMEETNRYKKMMENSDEQQISNRKT